MPCWVSQVKSFICTRYNLHFLRRVQLNVCRQALPSLLGASGRGHFSGNMRTYFIQLYCLRLTVRSYIKLTILTFGPVSSGRLHMKLSGSKGVNRGKERHKERSCRGDFQGRAQLRNDREGRSVKRGGTVNSQGEGSRTRERWTEYDRD